MLFRHSFKNYVDISIRCLQLFSMKWEKNQFGGGKVVGQAIVLAHWAHKVGGRLPASALPNRLRRHWLSLSWLAFPGFVVSSHQRKTCHVLVFL